MNKKRMVSFLEWKQYINFNDERKNFQKIHELILLTKEEFINLCKESSDSSINILNKKRINEKIRKNKTKSFSKLIRKPDKTISGWCKKINIDPKVFNKSIQIRDTTKLRIESFDDNFILTEKDYNTARFKQNLNKLNEDQINNQLQYLKNVYQEENNRQLKADTKAQNIIGRSTIFISAISLFGVLESVKAIKNFKIIFLILISISFLFCIFFLVISIILGVKSVTPKYVLRPRQDNIYTKFIKDQNIQYIKALYNSISINQETNNGKNNLNTKADICFVIGLIFLILSIILFYIGYFNSPEDKSLPFLIEKIKEIIILRNYII